MKPQRPSTNKPSHGQAQGQGSGRGGSNGARKVLRWLVQGHDLAAIARRLDRDEEKLKKRLAALLARLGVDSPQAALELLKAQQGAGTPEQGSAQDEFADVDAGDDDDDAAQEPDAAVIDESTK